MIFLKTLQLNNFLSHENTTINFVEGEKTLLDGASGAGKSSIFDAILWALYGQGRADNRSLVRKGAKKGSVVLELARDDKDVVIITRTATSGGKHTLELAIRKPDGTTAAYPLSGLRELQTFIDKELIGASYLLFINSVAYVQGNSESFVAQTAPKRKELLLEIIKAEDYDKYYEQARRTLSDLENARSRALGQVSELESRLTSLKDNLDVREPLLKTINDRTQLLEEIEPKIIELENQKATFLSISQTIKVLKDTFRITLNDKDILGTTLASKMFRVSDNPQILCIKNKYPEIVKDIEKTTAKLVELRKNLADISVQEVKRNEYYAKKPNINNYNFQNIERTQEKIDKIKAQPVCPSGIDCPYSGDHTKEIEDLKTQISELNKTIALETSAMVVWSEGAKQLPPAIDLQSLMKEIGDVEYYIKILEIEAEIPPLEKDLAEKEERLKELGKQIKEVEETASTDELVRVSDELMKRKVNKDSYKAEIVKATAALEAIDKSEKEIKVINEKVKVIKGKELPSIEDQMKKVALIKDAFGSKGIETMVIDYLLPKLEDRINQVLAQLSDFRVRLDTQRKSADGESVIEGLFITILNEMNEEMPFEAYSGGEKLKISVSISEALATLQKVGFRLFDETFIGLDENSTESFAHVLDGLRKEFSQVLCISHLLQIKELFDKKLLIVKNNNISYVK